MNFAKSFRDKVFVVVDSDARIRRDDDLMAFVTAAGGGFQAIPKATKVRIAEVKVVEAGSRSSIVFGRATSVDGIRVLGWTSTRNLGEKCMNDTIGVVQPVPGASRFGPNAAWSDGEFWGNSSLPPSWTPSSIRAPRAEDDRALLSARGRCSRERHPGVAGQRISVVSGAEATA